MDPQVPYDSHLQDKGLDLLLVASLLWLLNLPSVLDFLVLSWEA